MHDLTVSSADDGRAFSIDVGQRVVVRVGGQLSDVRVAPLGGEPGPVTYPFGSPAAPVVDASAGTVSVTARSPGRAAIVGNVTGGGQFSITVTVRAPSGMMTPMSGQG